MGTAPGAASRRGVERARVNLRRTPYVRREAELLEEQDRVPADVELQRRPAKARRTGTVVVVLVPVFALEEMHQRQPADILRGCLVGAGVGPHVADTVDEALRVQRERQANRPDPEECRQAEGQAGAERQDHQRQLDARPYLILGLVDLLAVLRDR